MRPRKVELTELPDTAKRGNTFHRPSILPRRTKPGILARCWRAIARLWRRS